jgi:hypothetical protein
MDDADLEAKKKEGLVMKGPQEPQEQQQHQRQ